ncbi:sialidase-4-like [Stegostoma tigrinum]|uniref:sialidase-4-like n=1 Tax=Stegostoma tigrinum TaxID=3053191 RepID=UPI00286FEA0A|nr:sialidase-4-like [Stegostoma tigrinum]XP_059499089.1 sialidase-4-like [Stegostoma tigrinum]
MGSSNSTDTTVLFKQEDHFGYRIPALLHIPDTDVLLAISEKRLGPKDENADTLMLRKGIYNKFSKNFEWDDVTCIESAQLHDHRSMNPCPVYDKEKCTIFLFFIAVYDSVTEQEQLLSGRNFTRLCFVTSTDKGKTWSTAIDLTVCQLGQRINKWAMFAVGPGHGIQLRSGRLIIPAYAYEKKPGCQCRAFTFYSDDHGKSWRVGDFISKEECGECQMVAMHGGRGPEIVYCNARSIKHGKHQYRVQAFSTNGGGAFTEGCLVKKLVEPPNGCHGSIIHFHSSKISHMNIYPVIKKHHFQQEKGTSKLAKDFEIILFSHTTSMESRSDLGIYLGTYHGHSPTWTDPWVICHGPCAYSELAFIEIPGEEIPLVACLFECGSASESEQISFTVFQVDEIIKNILEIKPHDNSHC